MTTYRFVFLAVLGLTLAGCSDDPVGQAVADAITQNVCSIRNQNEFVYDTMQDLYFWNTELPAVDPASFDSPEALLAALRFEPIDRFSNIGDLVERQTFFGEGEFIGVGVTVTSQAQGTRSFVAQVLPGSPAESAGIVRGDEILSVNGQTIQQINDSGSTVGAAFGPDEVGAPVTLEITRDGTADTLMLEKAVVALAPVTVSTVIDRPSGPVAYLKFNTFTTPSFDALDAAFEQFATAGATSLILDLRYNGGGLLSVAEFLAELIGGMTTDGEIFNSLVYNADNSDRNVDLAYNDQPNALDLARVVIITGPGTASASESVANGLEPFLDVTLVGEQTFGKPVGSIGSQFCEKVLDAIVFEVRNAAGDGDYFDGLPVDCAAEDDLTNPLGDPLEASLAEALFFTDNGVCSSMTQAAQMRRAAELHIPLPESAWHVERGAY